MKKETKQKCPLLIKENEKFTCDEIGDIADIKTCLKGSEKEWANCTTYLVQYMKIAALSGHGEAKRKLKFPF